MNSNNSQDNDWDFEETGSLIDDYNLYYKGLGVEVPSTLLLVEKISNIFEKIIADNNANMSESTLFQAATQPKMTITAYMKRIHQYSLCSAETYIYCLIYIDRFNFCQGQTCLNPLNIHRMVITAMLISAKYNDDKRFAFKYFAKIGGVKCKDMKLFELFFLETIGFNLWIDRTLYNEYLKKILSRE